MIYEDEAKILGPFRIYEASQDINCMRRVFGLVEQFPPSSAPSKYLSKEEVKSRTWLWQSTTLPLDNWYFVC